MDLRRKLALAFAATHPLDAAVALERRPVEEIARGLGVLPPETAALVLARLAPGIAAETAVAMKPERAAPIFAHLPNDAASVLLRQVPEPQRNEILAALPGERTEALREVIGFPPGSAGALMDPAAPAVPGDLTAGAALDALRRNPRHALYNLYVMDRDHKLTGVLNLRELLEARDEERLETIAHPAHHRLVANAGPRAVVAHPGWREVTALPVTDGEGRYLGAVRYSALRRLEGELEEGKALDPTASALGDLFWTGMGGVIQALSGVFAPAARERRP